VKYRFYSLFVWLLISVAAPAFASDEMEKLLQQVKLTLSAQQQQDSARLQVFKNSAADKAQLLAALQQEMAGAQAQQTLLSTEFELRSNERVELASQLSAESAQLSALFSIAKNKAEDFTKQVRSSVSKLRYQESLNALAFSSQERVPSLQDLQSLWFVLLQDLVADAGVQQYQAPVVNQSGAIVVQSVTQLGPFAVLDEAGRYLKLNQDNSQLQVFNELPESLSDIGANYVKGASTELSIDPEKGKLFVLASQIPTLQERVEQGGVVGYVLISLGVLGLLVTLWRTLYLSWVSVKVSNQFKSKSARGNNPLGRVLLVLQETTLLEKAEMLVEKTLLEEAARLERFNSVVKLLAAVAPLLGLLGTVTGMIETFQSITLLGTSDPKLMAGGISQALITTVMGLCVAIPLLFAHSYISAKSRQLIELIQQHSLLALSGYLKQDSIQQSLTAEADENASVQLDLSSVSNERATANSIRSASLV
jgi:biopolymer transport protein ExbB